ncbi:MAG: nicotinate-nicotinamide nucleotide adenylyltransferase [Deltaproteobacteria bacterium]
MIGIYGGTFDPIHLGHIHLIQSLLQTKMFEKIVLIPAKQNPLKSSPSKIPETFRIKMLEASLRELNDPRVELWLGELKRPGVSYMKDTLQELQKDYGSDLTLILGNEVFQEFPKWKDPNLILNLANILVVERTLPFCDPHPILKACGIQDGELNEGTLFYANNSRWIKTVKINALPHSGTELREQLVNAWKTGGLSSPPQGIQRSVWLLIKENQLYAVN